MLPGNKPVRRTRRTVTGWSATLLASVVLATLTGSPGTAGAATAPRPTPGINWQPCAADATAQCGTLAVPIDWSHPNGPTFDLALARRTATDPAARVGALFFGPGGPGDSGVSRVANPNNFRRFSPELHRRFDIVSFDPRGVGASSPVRCSTELLNQRPTPVLTSQADFDRTVLYNRRLWQDCRERTGPVFDHVDTVSMARDLDAVRAALGETRLTYHGSSYGTLLGEQYAELFPHRVRAMVLESVVDHSLDTRDFLNTQTTAAQDSFDAFVAWCGRTESCPLYGQDVRAVWADLMDRAGRGEVPDPKDPSATLTPYALSGFLAPRALYNPDYAGLAGMISTLSAQARGGTVAARVADPIPTAPGAQTSSNYLAIFCQDWHLPIRDYREYAARLREMARIAPDLPYPQALAVVESCLGSPLVDNPQHRLKIHSEQPLLLLNAVHDPATGYNWATNVARQLGRHGVLLSYEGSGHGVYTATSCTRDTVDAYLIRLAVPAHGTRCPAAEPAPTASAG
ncbi:alpha/beta fold hydrolase [Plantactinospora sp. B5E13]|uniref:alpha/beta fold hydrolase n=1 Tax=unclassified Plantactinospora TaxID=2631981 RepID=UPI00325EA6AB